MRRLALACLLSLALTACTSSPTVLKVLYGQFDNFMARELLSFADFTAAQEAAIKQAVDQTVSWHRQQALPKYAAKLALLQQRLIDQTPDQNDIDWLYDEVTALGEEFEAQSPILRLIPLIKNLDVRQVEQIREKIDEELAEEQAELDELAHKDAAEFATERFAKFMRRVGLRLDEKQRTRVKAALEMRQLSDAAELQVWEKWADQLVAILQQRQQPDFAARFKTHYTARRDLIKNTYPEQWLADQKNTQAMLLDLFIDLSEKQKASMRAQFASLTEVALDLSSN